MSEKQVSADQKIAQHLVDLQGQLLARDQLLKNLQTHFNGKDEQGNSLMSSCCKDVRYYWEVVTQEIDQLLKARHVFDLTEARDWCTANYATPKEFMGYLILKKRSELLGRQLTWAETIEIVALTTGLSAEEKASLLRLDGESKDV